MGIRVHKDIGWGLYDLKTDDKGEINDPRINKEGYLFDVYDEKYSIEGYLEVLEKAFKENKKSIDITLDYSCIDDMKEAGVELYKCVTHDSEFGLKGVLHFVPPIHVSGWRRYDDHIDYYEESVNHEQHNRFQVLDRPIYPYSHYIDIDSLNDEGYPEKIYFQDKINFLQDLFYKDILEEKHKEKLTKEFGFYNKDDYKRRIVPAIPNGLIMLLKYMNIFTDDKYIFDLRPMIYVHWS